MCIGWHVSFLRGVKVSPLTTGPGDYAQLLLCSSVTCVCVCVCAHSCMLVWTNSFSSSLTRAQWSHSSIPPLTPPRPQPQLSSEKTEQDEHWHLHVGCMLLPSSLSHSWTCVLGEWGESLCCSDLCGQVGRYDLKFISREANVLWTTSRPSEERTIWCLSSWMC